MARRAAGRVFPFDIAPTAGFQRYGSEIRANLDRIVELLKDPCLGTRLRHPHSVTEGEFRWDDFCKLELPRRLRLIYLWDPQEQWIRLQMAGFHLSSGESISIYDRFARLLDLPPYGQLADQDEVPCCAGVRPDGRTYREADARQDILRRTR